MTHTHVVDEMSPRPGNPGGSESWIRNHLRQADHGGEHYQQTAEVVSLAGYLQDAYGWHRYWHTHHDPLPPPDSYQKGAAPPPQLTWDDTVWPTGGQPMTVTSGRGPEDGPYVDVPWSGSPAGWVPPRYGNCTCQCHTFPMKHMRACCWPPMPVEPGPDAARDFGDVPIDDDTGQPSSPPVTLDHWEIAIVARAIMTEGPPSQVLSSYGTGMSPLHVALGLLSETDWPR